MAVTRTPRGWSVITPIGTEDAADLVEGLSLADLVAEEYGATLEPDRSARRSARGAAESTCADGANDPRIAALERTVAQLEHALAARVTTERAIGVLAERHGTGARLAFESLRRDARSHGRPVHELAREVLDSLQPDLDSPRAELATSSGGAEGRPDGTALHVAPAPPSPSRRRAATPLVVPVPAAEAVVEGRS